jgi:hypothetical protein
VGISRGYMEKWKEDPEFLQMLEEIQFHKKNFYERALIGLVAENHAGAILFVNKTYNADRGYSERLDLNVNAQTGRVDWSIDDLDLDLETQKKLLAAIERKKREEGASEDFDDPEVAPRPGQQPKPMKALPSPAAKKI